MNRKAVIFGIRGYRLLQSEKSLFKRTRPWGFILFSRNVKNLTQLKNLINEIKKTVSDKKCPILIDMEGGKVSRLNKIMDFSNFSQYYFGQLYNKNKKNFNNYYKIYVSTVSSILRRVGININTVPVLDIRRKKSHNIIGSRSFSENPLNVSKLGNICIKLFNENKIATVIKHIPGHGLSKCDSHKKTPMIKVKKRELIKNDFIPFKSCKSIFAMTAHAVYSAYDPNNTATHSKIIISKIIRNHMNFRGILISDDISMKALKYRLEKNAINAIQAGCNVVLHCNGRIKEMHRLVKVVPNIDNFTQKKTSQFYKFLR